VNTSGTSQALVFDDSIFWRGSFPDSVDYISIERMSTQVMDGIYKNLRRDPQRGLWYIHRETERHWGIARDTTSPVQPVDGKVIA
jgi:hypothetical protein